MEDSPCATLGSKNNLPMIWLDSVKLGVKNMHASIYSHTQGYTQLQKEYGGYRFHCKVMKFM